MDATFRLRKLYRNLGIGGLLCSAGMTALSICFTVSEARGLGALCVVIGVCGFFEGLSGFVLLAYWRESLTIKDQQIVQAGVVCRRMHGVSNGVAE
jgi:hypothetical protein